jgi:hypothetical protein
VNGGKDLPLFLRVAFKQESYYYIALQVSLDLIFLDRLDVREREQGNDAEHTFASFCKNARGKSRRVGMSMRGIAESGGHWVVAQV